MRIAVLGAGGPAGVNTCRALHAAGHDVIGVDTNPLHLKWAEPYCVETDHVYDSLPANVDLFHAQPEKQVRSLAFSGLPKLMPHYEVIRKCQHKPTAIREWLLVGLRRFPPVSALEPPFWLRAATGAGAKAATLVENIDTAQHWMRYWASRGEQIEWSAEEYLPGRDFCWTGVYRQGMLYASFARERLEWLYPHLAPSGRTGTPTVSQVVHDERVNETAKQAIYAIDPEPNGIYAVDLREDRDGIPRPTEINAGRWPTTSPLYFELGPNLPDLHARLASGEKLEPWGDDIYPAGTQLLRHIDCGHHWLSQPDSETDARHPYRVPVVA